MRDTAKKKEQLIAELVAMRQRVAQLEGFEKKREQMEEALRDSEQKYRLLAEHARDIIWTVDLDLQLTYISPSITRILGYDVEEPVGSVVLDLLTPATAKLARELFDAEIAEALARERAGMELQIKGPVIESEVYHKDGRTLWVETRLSFLRGDRGQAVGIMGVTRDTTERKQAQEALRESEEHYSALVKNLTDAVFLFKGGEIAWCNDRVEEIYGHTKDELLGKHASFFYPSDIPEADYVREVSNSIAIRGFFRNTAKFRRGDGSLVDIEYSLSQIPDRDPTELIAVGRDVTEHKSMEAALRKSEEHFRALIENSLDAVAILDGDGIVLYESPSVERVLGYKPEELAGKNVLDLVHPDDVQRVTDAYSAQADAPREAVSIEARFLHKDGRWRIIESIGSNLLDEPAVKGIVVNYRDVTERRQAEEALRWSEQYFRSLIENSLDAIVILDGEGLVRYQSPSVQRLLGYEPEELIGTDFFQFVHPDDWPTVTQTYAQLIQNPGTALKMEARGRHKDGSWRAFEAVVNNLLDNPPVAGVVINFRDVTDRKEAESEIKRYSERLEELVEERTVELRDAQEQLVRKERLAVLGQLAGGVGHELRNPLGAIKNAAYFLNMALEQPQSEVKETLEILEREVAASERIISTLLDFARQPPPTRRWVDINNLVGETISYVHIPDNVRVVSQFEATLPTILADPGQLGEIFGNTILNAVQAMPEGGRLTVTSGLSSPGWIAVSVTDTGVGMSAETLGKAFEPLFSTKAKGIGLGLALAKMHVEAHGGTIEVASETGKGSTFTVSLPIGSP